MNDSKNRQAEKAIKITTALTFIVAGYEIFRSCQNYSLGMNLLDIASFANADLNTYCLVLILTNIILLPRALLLYKDSNISLKNEIFSRDSLIKDTLLGVSLAVISS
ncbi:MAG: hypothetical protein J1E39_08030, partial [Eubacterium sp.]|nr:hypothetical protein [Eubacterium sp.]